MVVVPRGTSMGEEGSLFEPMVFSAPHLVLGLRGVIPQSGQVEDTVGHDAMELIQWFGFQLFGVVSSAVDGDDDVRGEPLCGRSGKREDVGVVVVIKVFPVEGQHLLIIGEEEVQFTDVMTLPTGAILNPGAHSAAMSEPKRRVEELEGDGARGVH